MLPSQEPSEVIAGRAPELELGSMFGAAVGVLGHNFS